MSLLLGAETWEKLCIVGVGPQPRSQSIAVAVSPLHLRADTALITPTTSSGASILTSMPANLCQKPPSYCFPGNRVSPCPDDDTPPPPYEESSQNGNFSNTIGNWH